MNKIVIQITGEAATGKSRISHLIEKTLKSFGFDVTIETDPDYDSESKFKSSMEDHFDDVIKGIAEKTKVEIKQKNIIVPLSNN